MAFEPKLQSPRTSPFLAKELRAELLALAVSGAPRECCGLLFARTLEKGDAVVRIVSIPNAAPECEAEERFELDPAAWVVAEAEATARGERFAGIWHSHPDGPPRPSRADEQGAASLPSGCAYVLVDLASAGGPGEITVWKWCPTTRPSPRPGDRRTP